MRKLPPLTRTGIKDQGGNPFLPGSGWNVIFEPPLWQASADAGEIYQIAADGPTGSSFQMALNGIPWNFVLQGWQQYWDPAQPALVDVTDTVQFYWNAAFAAGPYTPSGGSNVLPTVTLHFRTSE